MIKLSGYKVIKKIGSGGMGDVYLAEHEKLEKKVAIKSLHKNLATDSSFRERFSQEAKTHSKLDHPNIVKLLDYKERKDGLFLVMEYVDGKQLDEHIKKVTGPIPEKQLTILFTQILDAIGYAHKKGLVHRDIKPSNIMIDKEGRIKVLDFGIAKMQEEEKGLTKTGMQIGTASYMSPEQVNAKKVDKLTDIYSLGVTLFYMAAGKPPYDGETNTFSIQTKIVSDPFPKASDIYPGVSKKLEAIILKATQKDKKDRYKSCDEFKKDINSKNLVIPKVSETSNQKHVVKKEKKPKLIPVISVILLFVIVGFIGFYNNYQTKLEKQREEIQDLRLEKEKEYKKRLAEENRIKDESDGSGEIGQDPKEKDKKEKEEREEEKRKQKEEKEKKEENKRLTEEKRLAEEKRLSSRLLKTQRRYTNNTLVQLKGNQPSKRADMIRFLGDKKIENEAILEAMGKVPMEFFLPNSAREMFDKLYKDNPVPIGYSESISQPYTTAAILTLLNLEEGDYVLELKTASGYQTVLLAEMGMHVTTIESDKSLVRNELSKIFSELDFPEDDLYSNKSLKLIVGDYLRSGPSSVPQGGYDAIVATASYATVPNLIVDKLAPNGIFILPLGRQDQELIMIKKSYNGSISKTSLGSFHFSMMPDE